MNWHYFQQTAVFQYQDADFPNRQCSARLLLEVMLVAIPFRNETRNVGIHAEVNPGLGLTVWNDQSTCQAPHEKLSAMLSMDMIVGLLGWYSTESPWITAIK